ncbi:hypothetical protein ACQP2K_16280 [Microbispora siamensis]
MESWRTTGAPPAYFGGGLVPAADASRLDTSERLRIRGVRATAAADRIRFGFHYYNTADEVDAISCLLIEEAG